MFVLETKQPLTIPPICMCCGRETSHAVVQRAGSANAQQQEAAMGCIGMLFPPVHLAQAVLTLQKKEIRIPLCRRCQLSHFLPAPQLRLPLLGFVCLVATACYSFLHYKEGTGFAAALGAFILLIVIARKNARHEARFLPLQVCFEKGLYRYVVWGGPLLEVLRAASQSQADQHP